MEDVFVVKTADGGEVRGKTVLFATGKARSGLSVPGFEEYRGKGISFCAVCDGFFYKGKKLALLGSADYAAAEYAELAHFTQDITVFTNGAEVSPSVAGHFGSAPLVTGKIASFEGTADRLSSIHMQDGSSYSVDGCFVAMGTAGAAEFAAKLGLEMKGHDIGVDQQFMTNLPGIFAAGDCTGGYLQVSKAVADGALAAKGMVAFLKALG
jgi:thioredoxin reductase (NADPH)